MDRRKLGLIILIIALGLDYSVVFLLIGIPLTAIGGYLALFGKSGRRR